MKFLTQSEAKTLDCELIDKVGYKMEQLMEISGFNCASCILYCINNSYFSKYCISSIQQSTSESPITIFCGPGNNGGDGLVIARYIKLFGGFPIIIYPKKAKHTFFDNLLILIDSFQIPCFERIEDALNIGNSLLFIDALFGFSYNNQHKIPYNEILEFMIEHASLKNIPIVSIDVPSGWTIDVEEDENRKLAPEVLISLTAPKVCSKSYKGLHFIAASFLTPEISKKYDIEYVNEIFVKKGATQFVKLI